MQKNKIALLLILTAFLGSCVTQRRCTNKFPVRSSKDSIYIENVKEVPVYLPGDSIKVNIPINCPDQELVNMETGKLKQQISILKGRLISNTIIKPDTVFVHTKETVTKTKEVKVPEKIKFVPKFFKFCTWGFIFIILAVIAYFVIKYKLKIVSLFK